MKTRRRAALPLLLLAALVGCGEKTPPHPEADRAYATLEAEASEAVRREVLRTCDKWKRLDGPCDEAAVRHDQIDCWLGKSLTRLHAYQKKGTRPRARDRGTMRVHNLCMEKRGWRFVEPTGYF
jgi:hypothetical protein